MHAYNFVFFSITNSAGPHFLPLDGINVVQAISEGPITNRSIVSSTDSAPTPRIRGSSN